MGAVENYEKEFVERTREILSKYDGDYKLTNLVNCCLGLVILPFEKMNRNNFLNWNESIEDLQNEIGFNLITFEPVKSRRNGQIEYYPKDISAFLRKLRNGLTHQRIEAVNNDGYFTGIRIRTSENDLEVEFNRSQLEKLCLYICDRYLESFPELI